MKIYYETNETYVVAQNKQELLDYLLNVDCNSENPVKYTARVAVTADNHYVLAVDIKKFRTSVSYPLIIADGVDTRCITRQYDTLEIFRYNLKEFLDYIDTLSTKTEKEKEYNKLLKEITPKTPKASKPTKVKTEINPNEMVCNRVEKYRGRDGMIYTKYIYTRGGI